MCVNGRKKLNQLHSNRDINFSARRLLLLSVVQPSVVVQFGIVIRIRLVL